MLHILMTWQAGSYEWAFPFGSQLSKTRQRARAGECVGTWPLLQKIDERCMTVA